VGQLLKDVFCPKAPSIGPAQDGLTEAVDDRRDAAPTILAIKDRGEVSLLKLIRSYQL
jgi:hypothetical protein